MLEVFEIVQEKDFASLVTSITCFRGVTTILREREGGGAFKQTCHFTCYYTLKEVWRQWKGKGQRKNRGERGNMVMTKEIIGWKNILKCKEGWFSWRLDGRNDIYWMECGKV